MEINTHIGLDGVDHNQGGGLAGSARAAGAMVDFCTATRALIASQDLLPDHARTPPRSAT
ncbi:hypothetical protein [Mycobacterium sp.]|uniref:hypothetical protein n=1 Tax=Mycobacterium sp. TaxID=1785 RepID=UPI0031D2AAB6